MKYCLTRQEWVFNVNTMREITGNVVYINLKNIWFVEIIYFDSVQCTVCFRMLHVHSNQMIHLNETHCSVISVGLGATVIMQWLVTVIFMSQHTRPNLLRFFYSCQFNCACSVWIPKGFFFENQEYFIAWKVAWQSPPYCNHIIS